MMPGPGPRGFTLVEVMVVLVVIGVIVTFVGFSLGGDSRDEALATEAQRLVALLGLASEEAVMEGRELAVYFDRGGYRFFRLEESGWTPLDEVRVWRARELPMGMELSLRLDEPGDEVDTPEPEQPQVFLLSSGEMTPFEVSLQMVDLDRHYRVTGQVMGRLAWEGPLE